MTGDAQIGGALRRSVEKLKDQRYIFGAVVFLGLLLAAVLVDGQSGPIAAIEVTAVLAGLSVVTVVTVRFLPEPVGVGASRSAQSIRWSEKNTVLIRNLLTGRAHTLVYQAVAKAVEAAAESFGVDRLQVRAALHARHGSKVHIMPEFNVGEFLPGEHTTSMRLGEGCAGTALSKQAPVYYPRASEPKRYSLPDREEPKLHPGLDWVVAIPIPVATDESSISAWTLNVDGLYDAERTEADLWQLLTALTASAALIGQTLSDAVTKESR